MDATERIIADKVVLMLYHAPNNRLYLSDILRNSFHDAQSLSALLNTLRNKTIIEMPESTGILTDPLVQLTDLGLILGSKLEASDTDYKYKLVNSIRSRGGANAAWNEKYPMIHSRLAGHKKFQLYAFVVFGGIMLLLWALYEIGLI